MASSFNFGYPQTSAQNYFTPSNIYQGNSFNPAVSGFGNSLNSFASSPYGSLPYQPSSYGPQNSFAPQNDYYVNNYGAQLPFSIFGLPQSNDPYLGNSTSIVPFVNPARAQEIINKFDKNMRKYDNAEKSFHELDVKEERDLRFFAFNNPMTRAATIIQTVEGSLGSYRSNPTAYTNWFGANAANPPVVQNSNWYDAGYQTYLDPSYYPLNGGQSPFQSPYLPQYNQQAYYSGQPYQQQGNYNQLPYYSQQPYYNQQPGYYQGY